MSKFSFLIRCFGVLQAHKIVPISRFFSERIDFFDLRDFIVYVKETVHVYTHVSFFVFILENKTESFPPIRFTPANEIDKRSL